MNKLELKKFKKMSKEQIKYISDNAMLCLDYMQFDQEHKPSEILCEIISSNFDYLNNLNKDSIEYLYARFSWGIEILEDYTISTEDDFYIRLNEVFFIERDDVPKCIKEVLSAIDNDSLRKEIYDIGETIFNYNCDRIKFIELYPCEIKDISNLMDIETQEDGLRTLSIVEDSTLETFTVPFENSIEADIKICSGQSNCFIDPVLYDDGEEVCLLDCEGDFYSGKEFKFKYNNTKYTVVIYDKLKEFEDGIIEALSKYSSDNVDIINEEDTSKIYLTYHSENNSFSLNERTIDYSRYTLNEIETLFTSLGQLADKYDLGTVGI